MPEENEEEERHIECEQCGREIPEEDGFTIGSGVFCGDCVVICQSCDEVFPSDSEEISEARTGTRRTHSTETRCHGCFHQCADCNERFTHRDYGGENTDGEWVCESCNEEYATCDRCDCICPTEQVNYCEAAREYRCEECYEYSDDESDDDDDNGTIHNYQHRPTPRFHWGKDEKKSSKSRFFGIEIEAGTKLSLRDSEWAGKVSSSGLFYCKSDCSITDEPGMKSGFESVSHPATLSAWREADLSAFEEMRDAGYRSYDTVTCGMHIHVSRDSVSDFIQFKLLKFFRDNIPFIISVSRRRLTLLNRWAAVDKSDNAGIIRSVKYKSQSAGRYSAINLENPKTIEFRLFRGTLDVAAIRRNIEFVNALLHFCRFRGIEDMSAALFIEWIKGEGKGVIGKDASKSLSTWFYPILLNLNPDKVA